MQEFTDTSEAFDTSNSCNLLLVSVIPFSVRFSINFGAKSVSAQMDKKGWGGGGGGGRGKNTFNKIYLVQDLSISLEKFWQILHQLIDGIQTSLFVHCCWFVQHRLGNCLSWQVFYGCRQVQRRKNTEKGTQKPWCKQHNAVDLEAISAGNRILFHFIKFFDTLE